MKLHIFLILTSLLAIFSTRCSMLAPQERAFKKAEITVRNEANKTIFRVSEYVRGVVLIQITDVKTGEILWQVNSRLYKKNDIVYGNMDQFYREDKIATMVELSLAHPPGMSHPVSPSAPYGRQYRNAKPK